jgi:hypothetical protein
VVAASTYSLLEQGLRSDNVSQKLDRLIDTFVIDFLIENAREN